MDIESKFVVVAVAPNGNTNTASWNPTTRFAGSLEEAIALHRESMSSNTSTIYALPLADFIKHATPEKRGYTVTINATTVRTIMDATSQAEAAERAVSGVEVRYGRGLDWKVTNVEPVR
jgi:hypothetical protein